MKLRRKVQRFLYSGLVALCAGSSSNVLAGDYAAGTLKIENPWVRADVGDKGALLFMSVQNEGSAPDKLVAVRTSHFGRTVIHADPARIVVPHGVLLPPHATVLMEPGRPFVALHDPTRSPEVGSKVDVELVFEKAGKVTVEASVEAPDATRANDTEAMERWRAARAPKPTPASESPNDAPPAPPADEATPDPAALESK